VRIVDVSAVREWWWGWYGAGGQVSSSPAVNVRDDRVVAPTKALAIFVAPFLIVAFVLLYLFPADTQRLFAWTIKPTMTPMVLASAYLGGFYFFCRVPFVTRWATLKTGFLSVALFASLLGVATVLHWDKFNHGHLAFWLWAGLYFVAPFLVVAAWLNNRRFSAPPAAGERRLSGATRWVIGFIGVTALATGILLFALPDQMIPLWPWALTPLTCRVMGAIFCLGSAGIGVIADPRWINVKLMLQVELIMLTLILVAVVRATGEFFTERPMTWVMFIGFIAVILGSAFLLISHRRDDRVADSTREPQS
jgi:hypothetical protein